MENLSVWGRRYGCMGRSSLALSLEREELRRENADRKDNVAYRGYRGGRKRDTVESKPKGASTDLRGTRMHDERMPRLEGFVFIIRYANGRVRAQASTERRRSSPLGHRASSPLSFSIPTYLRS